MPKITLVREDRIDPFWYVKITGDARSVITEAIEETHPECRQNTCDIHAAIEAGFPFAAAYLLSSATEVYPLDAAVRALEFNGVELPLFFDEFDEWCASDASNSVECPACGSHVYSDFGDGCGMCLADLTIDVDVMAEEYMATALWSSHNELFRTSPCDKCGTRVAEFTNAYGTEWRDAVNEMDADCSEGGAHEVADPEDHSEMLDDEYGTDDIDESSRDEMRADCQSFAESNIADLAGMDPGQAGHDFWLTRNHHGAGFWDRGLGARGDRLTASAEPYGESNLYAGDDGAVHVS